MSIDQKWSQAKTLSNALNLRSNALVSRSEILYDAYLILDLNDIAVPEIMQWINAVSDLQSRDIRIQRTIGDVELERLGLRESGDDIDIMAPPGTTDDELSQYRDLGWIPIAIGVVVVIGVLAMLYHEHQEANELRKKYKPLYDLANDKLRGDPQWEEKKRSVEFARRKSTWERLETAAKSLVGGAKIGIAIAIPIAILVLWSWLKNDR
jgi:hypothetical protein